MKESEFIANNQQDWRELEKLLAQQNKDADLLHKLFVKVSSDLTYARSFYPKRSVRLYLNGLTQRVFDSIQSQEDKLEISKISKFFKEILPYQIYESRKSMFLALATFILAVLIGVFSSIQDPEFLKVIVGEDYVEMTEENINNQDPMAVYKQSEESQMFFSITMNNVKVAFLAFVMGFLGIYGTLIVLLYNGIMLGAFQYFFYSKGLFWTSFLTIWIHGTLEIAAIIIAGAAGIVLGKGVVFTKTYEWSTSSQVAALKGLRILLGTVPLFFLAGFLEGFATRHTEWPTAVKASIILASLALLFYLYIYLPWSRHKEGILTQSVHQIKPSHQFTNKPEMLRPMTFGEIISMGFVHTIKNFNSYLKFVLLPVLLLFMTFIYVTVLLNGEDWVVQSTNWLRVNHVDALKESGIAMVGLLSLLIFYVSIALKVLDNDDLGINRSHIKESLTSYGIGTLLYSLVIATLMTYLSRMYIVGVIILLPISQLFYYLAIESDRRTEKPLNYAIRFSYRHYLFTLGVTLVLYLIYVCLSTFMTVGVGGILTDFIGWHNLTGSEAGDALVSIYLIDSLSILLMIPIAYGVYKATYYARISKVEGADLVSRMEKFGKRSNTFEAKA